ncbi:outer membrane protein assembly factor BamB family protein [Paraliomyxa miuraensis]|uniref:outer membrane protein assembly factor BamB family protein n=1 Tax=Paraliomyxa miuraensis TaxID=376150 RepID=UPI0022526058|nr:PQQ-binding-like beta-propeller repeat protein [Paraliomyxa miuraensis]MCX4244572.1 PQQ-binding-like beta-propeller repeat protein [Paraliomyxa miuraensis]
MTGIVRNRLGAVALLLTACLGAGACGAREEAELVYPAQDAAARAVMAVDYMRQLTTPDNFVLRPDEFGAATVDAAAKVVYVGTREGYLLVLDAEDGAIRQERALEDSVFGIPVLVPGSGPSGSPDEPLLVVGTDNGTIHALDPSDLQTRWRYETPGRIRNAPLVHEGVVFFVNSRDQIYALDLRSGEWRWQYEQELQTDFTVHGHAGLSLRPASEAGTGLGTELGTLFACFDSGKVAALAAGSGQALWLASVAPPEGGDFIDCDSTPLLDPDAGVVYVAGQSTGVFALELDSGEERWRFPMRGAAALVPIPEGAGGGLLGTSSLEGVFVLERDGSRLRWRTRANPGVLSEPVLVDGAVFVTHSELGLLAFDLDTGELLAQLRTGSGMASVPTYDRQLQRVFAMSNRGTFVAMRVGEALDSFVSIGAR